MFTEKNKNQNEESVVFVNPIQEYPIRSSVYAINKCEDQVIGFEFVTKSKTAKGKCFNGVPINVCVPVEVSSQVELSEVEFLATDDPCYQNWKITKTEKPSIEVQYDLNGEYAVGVLVRFFKEDTCCYPSQMAFRLNAIDNKCKYSISRGLLVFR